MKSKQIKNKQTNIWKSIFGGVVGTSIVLSMALYLDIPNAITTQHSPTVYSQNQQNTQALNDFESAIMGAVGVAGDAVVSVSNLQSINQYSQISDYYGSFFGSRGGSIDLQDPEESLEKVGSGSGVVYKIEGDYAYIVTNNHVVENADKLEIITANGETLDAELIGTDVFTDLAVLKVAATNLNTTVEFADSDNLQVGTLAIAIGSPLGSEFSNSVTQGIISGIDRTIDVDLNGDRKIDWQMNLLQTDAAINPGNSGGALINKNGQLIGINSSKFSSTKIEGMGFAIPSNQVQNIISQLEKNGKVTRPVLGVNRVYPVSELKVQSKVEILGIPEDADKGVVVEIVPGSAADKAGLEKYDIITHVNEAEVNNMMMLRQELYKYDIGETITLTIIRDGDFQNINVALESEEGLVEQ